MAILQILRRRLRNLFARDISPIPSLCYNECNNAYIQAQQTGKSPALCDTTVNNSFLVIFTDCSACVAAHSTNASSAADSLNSIPEFAQFIDYCNSVADNSTLNASSATSAVATWTVPYSATGSDGVVVTGMFTTSIYPKIENITFKTTLNGIPISWDILTTKTSFPNPSALQGTTSLFASPSSEPSTSVVPPTPSGSSSTTLTQKQHSQASKAWIAGPVVVAIAIVAIVFSATWIWLHMRRRRRGRAEIGKTMVATNAFQQGQQTQSIFVKSELHGDSLVHDQQPQSFFINELHGDSLVQDQRRD